jgi:hypothetical protein
MSARRQIRQINNAILKVPDAAQWIRSFLARIPAAEQLSCAEGGFLYIRYRGFKRKGACVHIITFRFATRLHSKSNRCI